LGVQAIPFARGEAQPPDGKIVIGAKGGASRPPLRFSGDIASVLVVFFQALALL